jgi:hypothetical protein
MASAFVMGSTFPHSADHAASHAGAVRRAFGKPGLSGL